MKVFRKGSAARRDVLGLAMGAALAPVFLPRRAAASDGTGISAPAIRPPDTRMLYTRTLHRELVGDAGLTVSRGFAVRFDATDAGFRIEGHQVQVDVDAPEHIADLAQLEAQRVEDGIFPLDLDRTGRIVDGARCSNLAIFDEAVRIASERIGKQHLAIDERVQIEQFVTAVHRASAHLTSNLPVSLFAPPTGVTTERRDIDMPGGEEGEVQSVFEAETDPGTGLMKTARREILTVLAGKSRKTVETWSLVPA